VSLFKFIILCFCTGLVRYSCVAFVVLGLVPSVPSREIGKEERLRNGLLCVEWDVKTLTLSINQPAVSDCIFSSNVSAGRGVENIASGSEETEDGVTCR